MSSLDNYIAYTTVVAETTQKSAESVGESFKTLYARFGKIAAGKFETSQEELEQQGLSSEDMSNLNEIEQVLKAVGIKLRDTPEHFRDIDSVLAEIAGKWNTFSDVQKSGISTAVAGTRQRENFLVLMENWDNVSKYAEIAANAYGTAVEKMEAYSQGVEAARKRVQAAWEGFALVINESGALEVAFNTLATAIENLHLIILSLIGALIINNPEAALGTLTTAFTKLGTFLNTRGLEGMLGSGKKDIFTKEFQENLRKQSVENAFVTQKQAMFGDYLGNFKGNLDNNRFAGMVEYQSGLIGLEKNASNAQFLQGLGALAGGINLKDTLKMGEGLRLLNSAVLTGEQAQIVLNTVTKDVSDALIKEKMAVAQGTTDEEKLAWARQAAAKDLLIDMTEGDKSKYYDENARRTFAAATGTGMRGNELEQREMQNRAYASMAGSVIGMYGARTLMGNLAAGVGGEDARSAGESIGSIIGMFAGEKAASSLFTAIKGVARGTMASSALVAPILGVAVLAIGAIIGLVSATRKKEIEKAQNEFKELKDTYESQLSGSTKASRYDELSEGVDQFGRNVSLTDEEYSEFLSTSNELATLFPELVVRTDEAGNSFLGTAGKVGKLTESIEEMVKASQKAADQQLLSKDVFKTAFDEAKTEAQNKEYQLNSLRDLLNKQEQAVANGGVFEVTDSFGGPIEKIEATEKDINNTKNAISNLEKELAQAGGSMTDWANAIVREDENLQKALNSLSDDAAVMAKQTMQNVFASINPADYKDWNEYASVIENLSNKIAEAYKNNPRLVELETNRTGNAGEYFGNRKKLLESLVDSFGGYADLDESEKKILIGIGFEFDEDGNWFDTTDIRKKIEDEGLGAKLTGVNLDAFSKDDLERAYEILKGSVFGAKFNTEQLQQAIFADKYSDAGLSKLASLYKSYAEEDDLTPIEQKNKEFIEGKLDGWAKELGVVKGNYKDISAYYDEIIRKAKIYGNIDSAGMTQETPEEVKERMDKYVKYYKFIRDEYSKTGKWDLDTYNEMIKDKDLQGYLANNDVSGLTKFLKETLEDAPNIYKNAYQAILWENENINKEMQEKHKETYEEFEEDYGFDLTKFTTLNAAKETIDLYTKGILEGNWEDWKNALSKYYDEDLALFTSAAMQKIVLNELIAKDQQSMSSDEYRTFKYKTYQKWVDAGGEKGTGMNATDFETQELYAVDKQGKLNQFKGNLQDYANAINEALQGVANLIPRGDINYDILDDGTSQLGKDLERIEALIGMYQKEYYLRKSLIEQGNLTAEGQDSFMSPEYYDRMRNAYQMQADYYKQRIPWNKDISQWSAEQMGYYQKYQQAMINLNNLDDEQIEDKINILQLQDVSYDQLIAAQEELIKTSDTLEEQITRENELNNLIKQRYELYRDIASWQREMLDIALEYESGSPDTALYADLVGQKKQNLENEMEAVKQRMAEIQDSDRKDKQEELRNLAKQYAELYKEYATVDIDVLNDKLDVLERRLDLLEKSKPQEWAKYDDIAPYYQQNIGYLEQKAALIREQLEDVSMLTDEQVQNLVDQLNDVTVALHEAQMQMLEDQKNYKESQYNALVSKVQEYITELEDAMDEIEKAYEDELKPLEQANEERERAIKLEELLAAKKRAAQEKERVYREGKLNALVKDSYIG